MERTHIDSYLYSYDFSIKVKMHIKEFFVKSRLFQRWYMSVFCNNYSNVMFVVDIRFSINPHNIIGYDCNMRPSQERFSDRILGCIIQEISIRWWLQMIFIRYLYRDNNIVSCCLWCHYMFHNIMFLWFMTPTTQVGRGTRFRTRPITDIKHEHIPSIAVPADDLTMLITNSIPF